MTLVDRLSSEIWEVVMRVRLFVDLFNRLNVVVFWPTVLAEDHTS